ncbi:thioesterase domain-containing protein [Spongiibacter taiwanensis]|uniref:YiiD C-terminal domain-containing protein n=1 Tax=Spongiibacter taiwanensis TaxID=1748242 RepID=UPI0020357856|nr:YiiD C-terminal domain-containing protein [Spongiibacter taiwanensis]USA43741.1 thioesterase domain-containing protein [Spongiibacter taiwanensis]
MNTVEFSLSEFCRQTRQAIPLLQSMDLRFTEFGDHRLRVDMPLAPNINDKQTGFGGSIAALATAAGWAIVSLMLKSRPHRYDVMVTESHMRYLAPATCNFYAIANVSDSAMATFNQVLDEQRQGRITLQVMVEQDGKQVAVYTGTYKVIQRVSQ